MSDTIDFRRLRHTPLRDLARGRVTGRLDIRQKIEAATLPAAAGETILRVVRRTRLFRMEKAAVAEELIAHFADGLSSGVSAEELVHDFGDEKAAAKLIRRAMKRNRPWPWHVLRYGGYVAAAILLLDVVLFVRFFAGRPNVSVDYLAQLNAPTLRVPEAERAWPIYRQAILGFGMGKDGDDRVMEKTLAADAQRQFADATPADAEWPALRSWLDAHQTGFEKLREAAAKQGLGFVLGPDGPAYDPELGFNIKSYRIRGDVDSPLDASLISTLLTDLNPLRHMANLASADLRYAREQGDRLRIIADLDALMGMSRHLRQAEPFVVTRLVGLAIGQKAIANLRETIEQKPELLSDEDLIHAAHRIASTMNGDNALAFLDLAGERASIKDVIQRLYTDNGDGDGRLARPAVRAIGDLTLLTAGSSSRSPQPNNLSVQAKTAIVGSIVATLDARRATENEFARLTDLAASDLAKPLYAVDPANSGEAAIQRRIDEIGQSSIDRVRLILVPFLMPSLFEAQKMTERFIGNRDGAMVAIGLELYRRRHNGNYPASLAELAPVLLPEVPKDRINGEPLRYRLVEGKPVVYSVGFDRDDDGGRAPVGPDGKADPTLAAGWEVSSGASNRRGHATAGSSEGDWVLFDARTTP